MVMGSDPASNLEPLINPNHLSENDNETLEQQSDLLFPVTVKIENEEEERKDELRVQIFNLFCYECDTSFSSLVTFAQHNHRLTSSSSVQANKENGVKSKRKYKTRKRRSSIAILREVIRNTNVRKAGAGKLEDESRCLVGGDKILVECKKCMKNFKSLSEFLKHLDQKNVNKENRAMKNLPASPGQRQEEQPRKSSFQPEMTNEELLISQENAPMSPADDFDMDDGNGNIDKDDENDEDWISTSTQNHLESERKLAKNPEKRSPTKSDEDENNSKNSRIQEDKKNENEKPSNTAVTTLRKKKRGRPPKPKVERKRKVKKVRQYPCPRCDLTFPRIMELREHAKIHRNEKVLMCHLCSELFRSPIYLGKHIAIMHESDNKIPTGPACPVCFKVFPNQSHLASHSVIHRDERPFLCPKPSCPYAKIGFKMKNNLTKHIEGVHNSQDEMIPCRKCDKLFKTKALLKYHMRIHAEGRHKAFTCDVPDCGKSYFYAYHLAMHKKDHDVDIPLFHCDFCDKGFKRKSTLKLHIRCVHQNIRNHVCETCGKGFQKNFNLIVHQRTHSGVRLFPCLVCPNKAYTTKQQLINHNLRCHPPEPDRLTSSQLPPQSESEGHEENPQTLHFPDVNCNPFT